MSKKAKKKASQQTEQQQASFSGPWISMRSGIIIITILSLGMAVLTTIQVWPTRTPLQAILWGLIFGGMIWAIFLGYLYFNRWLRGGGQEKKE